MNVRSQYHRAVIRKLALGTGLLAALVAAAGYSITVGSLAIGPGALLDALLGVEAPFRHVLLSIRLPRTVGAVLAGAGLGVAGAVMQDILRNPLASPFTTGVSQGAACGAAFAIIVLGAGQVHAVGNEAVTVASPWLVVFAAFCGAMLAVACILGISSLRRVSAEAVILAGVALAAFFGAATMLLQYFASDMQVAATVFWTFGDLGKAGWRENGSMLCALGVALLWFRVAGWRHNALQWGDEVAESMGVRVVRLRVASLAASSFVVAVTTAFLGVIGFVGLLAPHTVRFLVGSDHRFLLPCSALFGALLLLGSDILARTVMQPVTLPVGIVTSLAGAPLFLALLIRKGRR
ncbi:MAG: iron ABC transporter permease [Thermodesulfobacteriota bacterium]